MSQPEIDMAAVARVSRRVQLSEVRLVKFEVEQFSRIPGKLVPEITHDFAISSESPDLLRVACSFGFNVTSNNVQVATSKIVYHLFYRMSGDEPADPKDLKQFAVANGSYNSWPFVRELLHSMTGRMGLPPYVLPVLIIKPRQQAALPATKPALASSKK